MTKGLAVLRPYKLVPFLVLALVVAGCAHQPTPMAHDAPGFLLGLLHGFICPFALIASIFTDVRIYAFPNSGVWYDFGFVTGAALLIGGVASQ